MDVQSTSGTLVPLSPNDLVTVKTDGPSGNLPKNKRKRTLSVENVENTEDRPKGKRVRKSRSNKDSHLTAEEAEERRKRVNEQERLRQKQISEAIERLRLLNLPYNPKLRNHKKYSNRCVFNTAAFVLGGLRKMLLDNGIDPDIHELPLKPKNAILGHYGTVSDDTSLQNGPVIVDQIPAQDVSTALTQCFGGEQIISSDKQSTSTVYRRIIPTVPQCTNKLVDGSNQQQYPYGHMYPQQNMGDLKSQKFLAQPQSYGDQSVTGLYSVNQINAAANSLERYNNGPLPGTSTGPHNGPLPGPSTGSLNGQSRMSGPPNVTNQTSQPVVKSSFPPSAVNVTPKLTSNLLVNHMQTAPTMSKPISTPNFTPKLTLNISTETLPSNPPHVVEVQPPNVSQPMTVSVNLSPKSTSCTSETNQNDSGEINLAFGNGSGMSESRRQALIDDFLSSWMD